MRTEDEIAEKTAIVPIVVSFKLKKKKKDITRKKAIPLRTENLKLRLSTNLKCILRVAV